MSIKRKLNDALDALEKARRHIKRAKDGIPDNPELRRALREIDEAVEEIERAKGQVDD